MRDEVKILICAWIGGFLIGLAFGLSIQSAIAEEPIDPYNCTMTVLCKFLEAILEEEKKQTALLDQIDCNLRHNVSPYRDSTASQTKHCGKLLNYTGVWIR